MRASRLREPSPWQPPWSTPHGVWTTTSLQTTCVYDEALADRADRQFWKIHLSTFMGAKRLPSPRRTRAQAAATKHCHPSQAGPFLSCEDEVDGAPDGLLARAKGTQLQNQRDAMSHRFAASLLGGPSPAACCRGMCAWHGRPSHVLKPFAIIHSSPPPLLLWSNLLRMPDGMLSSRAGIPLYSFLATRHHRYWSVLLTDEQKEPVAATQASKGFRLACRCCKSPPPPPLPPLSGRRPGGAARFRRFDSGREGPLPTPTHLRPLIPLHTDEDT